MFRFVARSWEEEEEAAAMVVKNGDPRWTAKTPPWLAPKESVRTQKQRQKTLPNIVVLVLSRGDGRWCEMNDREWLRLRSSAYESLAKLKLRHRMARKHRYANEEPACQQRRLNSSLGENSGEMV